jgi:predicted small lipoprotein YifL
MSRNRLSVVLSLVLTLGSLAACKKEGPAAPPAGTTPVDELVQAGKSPVEVGNLRRGLSPIAPTFSVTVSNVSDAPVKLINGTVVFFDENGKCLPDAVAEAGYTDLSPIAPGGKVELQILTPNEKAVSGTWVIKEVVYEKPNPLDKAYGNLPFKWANPNFEAALAAEKNK